MKITLIDLSKFPVFPLAEELPFITEEEEKELAQDLELNGQKQPIIIWNNPKVGPTLLDGRNRLKALHGTNKTEAWIEYFDGDESEAADQVYSLNVPRRHLNVGQKAAFALAYLPYEEEKAKNRQLRTEVNRILDQPLAAGQEKEKNYGNQARDTIARKVGVHGQRISEVKKLSLNAPDLFEEVKKGDKELTTAYKELKDRTDWDESKNDFIKEFPEAWDKLRSGELTRGEAYKLANKLQSAQNEARAQTVPKTVILLEKLRDVMRVHLPELNSSVEEHCQTAESIALVRILIGQIETDWAVFTTAIDLQEEFNE